MVSQIVDKTNVIERLAEDFPIEGFSHLIGLCQRSGGSGSLVHKALAYAFDHHGGQFRKSGEPYIIHPLSVAEIIVRDLELDDPETVAAAILHDVVEDVDKLDVKDIQEHFGRNVAEIVEGCTKITLLRSKPSDAKDKTYQKIAKMGSKRPEIILIKLADRLHNMETLDALPDSKRQRISLETIEVYAPLAAKLNLFTIKRRLYHLAILHRFPKQSKKVLRARNAMLNSEDTRTIQALLEKEYSDFGCPVSIRPRAKTLWSFYSPQREKKRKVNLDNAENHIDFTIILDTENPLHCYRALGAVNSNFTPIPKSIRDYIANRKENGYQSLHVRFIGNDVKYLVKIRTRLMDLYACKGILLKISEENILETYKKKISQVLRHIGDYEGSPTGRKTMLRRLTQLNEIYVYTPDGDMHNFPQGSIVQDFAYRIHTSLGNSCLYALVNNSEVPPSHVLKDGDIVEIITSDKPVELDPDLESQCRTSRAQSHINRRLQGIRRKYARAVGKEILHQEIARYGLAEDFLNSTKVEHFLNYKTYKNLDQLYESIGQDKDLPLEIITETEGDINYQRIRNTILINDLDPCVHKFSKCCNPLPSIGKTVAALSERGVSFHREGCGRLNGLKESIFERILDVDWGKFSLWHRPLRFDLNLTGITMTQSFSILSAIPKNIQVYRIQSVEEGSGRGLSMVVNLTGFAQAEAFFNGFNTSGIMLSIKKYSPVIQF